MEQEKNGKNKKKWKRRAATAAAGTLTAASLTVGALFGSADELLNGEDADAQQVQQAVASEQQQRAGATQKDPPLVERARAFFLSRSAVVRATVLLPLWAVGKAILSLFSLLLTALSPFWGVILGVLLNALLLIALFLFVYKTLFPHKSLKNLFRKGRWVYFLLGALVLGAADALLKRYVTQYRALSLFIKLFAGLVVLVCLCWRVLGPKIGTAPAEAA